LLLVALAPAALAFTEAEKRAIAAHGPWPPAFAPDPSNRASGKPAAIELGERLFFDRRLSSNGEHSCSRCHVPERNWTDGEVRARGLELTDRNTPSVANVRVQRWFGWDGAHDSLWAQSIRPILDARELGMSAARVAALVRGDADHSCRYRKGAGKTIKVEIVEATTALLLCGEALDEPIVGQGPFVMNTAQEIRQAIADYQSGKMGHL
jgi:cytochrome c peroxidase